jgi:methionyl-tRNA formyltransferase
MTSATAPASRLPGLPGHPLRIVYLANNRVGLAALELLRRDGTEIAGLVVHPADRQKHRAEIIAAAGVPADRIFDGSTLRDPAVLARITALDADLALSVFFGYLLRPDFLAAFRGNVLNLHPALLPYNRGAHPNVWSIIDGTPAGATLHYVDPGIDTGDIVAQAEVPVAATDTAATLYAKLEAASLDLLAATWPAIRAGTAPRTPQLATTGTSHKVRDLAALDRIDLDRPTTARELINLLRARSFPPHPGAYIDLDGQRIYLRLELTAADDDNDDDD